MHYREGLLLLLRIGLLAGLTLVGLLLASFSTCNTQTMMCVISLQTYILSFGWYGLKKTYIELSKVLLRLSTLTGGRGDLDLERDLQNSEKQNPVLKS